MRTIEEVVKQYKHICWYPSAGNDLRALLFLSEWYYRKHNVPLDEGQVFPELFILTDMRGLYDSFENSDYYDQGKLNHICYRRCEPGASILHASYMGRYTDIRVKSIEELRSHEFSYDPEMTSCPRTGNYNSAFFLEVEVETRKYETTNRYPAKVLYISVQNEFFIREFLVPNRVKVEYQVLVRYGREPKVPLSEELPHKIIRSHKKLGIRYLISNDDYVKVAYPDGTFYEPFYSINGSQWSGYGAVNWYKLT